MNSASRLYHGDPTSDQIQHPPFSHPQPIPLSFFGHLLLSLEQRKIARPPYGLTASVLVTLVGRDLEGLLAHYGPEMDKKPSHGDGLAVGGGGLAQT